MEFKYEGNSLKGGVYKITNSQNGRTYYGSAKEFKRRWKQHQYALQASKHSNKFLQADYLKCGPDAFVFEVLEVVEGARENRLEREGAFLKERFDGGKQCYNLCSQAISREGFGDKKQRKTRSDKGSGKQTRYVPVPHPRKKQVPWNKGKTECYSKKTLQEMRQAHSGKKQSPETIKKRVEKIKGQKRTAEQRAQISKGLRGKTLGRKMTEACRAALLSANTGREMSQKTREAIVASRIQTYDIVLVSPEGEKFGPITNLTKFCQEHCLERSLVTKVINRSRLHHKGWKLGQNLSSCPTELHP